MSKVSNMSNLRRCLTREQTMDYLGISKSNFYERVKEDLFPKSFQIGGRDLWDVQDLDRYIDAKKDAEINQWDSKTNDYQR